MDIMDINDTYIPGLQMDQGIKQLGGNKESYLRILRSYAAVIPPLLERLKEVTRENLEDYATTVHGIKGSSWGISALQTGEKAQSLETAAKEGDYAYVDAHNSSFISEAESLVADIERLLNQERPSSLKPLQDQPDRQVLARLLDACARYDMDSVDTAMAEIEACRYTSGNDLVSWLQHNVSQMNFRDIRKRLTAILCSP